MESFGLFSTVHSHTVNVRMAFIDNVTPRDSCLPTVHHLASESANACLSTTKKQEQPPPATSKSNHHHQEAEASITKDGEGNHKNHQQECQSLLMLRHFWTKKKGVDFEECRNADKHFVGSQGPASASNLKSVRASEKASLLLIIPVTTPSEACKHSSYAS